MGLIFLPWVLNLFAIFSLFSYNIGSWIEASHYSICFWGTKLCQDNYKCYRFCKFCKIISNMFHIFPGAIHKWKENYLKMIYFNNIQNWQKLITRVFSRWILGIGLCIEVWLYARYSHEYYISSSFPNSVKYVLLAWFYQWGNLSQETLSNLFIFIYSHCVHIRNFIIWS